MGIIYNIVRYMAQKRVRRFRKGTEGILSDRERAILLKQLQKEAVEINRQYQEKVLKYLLFASKALFFISLGLLDFGVLYYNENEVISEGAPVFIIAGGICLVLSIVFQKYFKKMYEDYIWKKYGLVIDAGL